MAKSRKQKLKVKDFQKQKLKVGKTQPKASNATNTSFVSKTLSIKNQHLERNTDDLSKKLSLLKHHNSTVRKEALQSFNKVIPRISKTRIMTPLLVQSIPLICDDSKTVRQSFMELIDEIGNHDVQVLKLHCKMFVLYINMAMTHIVPAIQNDSIKFLRCLLRYCGEETCKQSFTKLLSGILNLLGWGTNRKNASASAAQTTKRDSKQMAEYLDALHRLIYEGCAEKLKDNNDRHPEILNQYLIPDFPQPYESLKLFTRALRNTATQSNASSISSITDSISTQDREARRRILQEDFFDVITKRLDALIKEGGVSGKSSNTLKNLIATIN
ncbi:hypothetical protein HG535_0C03610 [Zygotorulaspora mrakii]|uniref:Pre-rRNA-processing protein n=1 Tax=Zygotorulaspora mrakii TaxID=42260 RepID=A0A7H9B055_ZYGMR|nr:uncharacterized protein HG535_0C03610 [Zygotorulaspora mrakii]QLG72008.1 hypothetical protein HG535_0C03610 [Zygotorulaspora mrakii]